VVHGGDQRFGFRNFLNLGGLLGNDPTTGGISNRSLFGKLRDHQHHRSRSRSETDQRCRAEKPLPPWRRLPSLSHDSSLLSGLRFMVRDGIYPQINPRHNPKLQEISLLIPGIGKMWGFFKKPPVFMNLGLGFIKKILNTSICVLSGKPHFDPMIDHRSSTLLSKVLRTLPMVIATALAAVAEAQTLYDFGNPTADEQLYLEYINRARANPPAEGTRLAATTDPAVLSAYSQYSVDLAMMKSEFNAITAAPPLVTNAQLNSIARSHSEWMLANAVQSHDEGSVSPFDRMTNAGYDYSWAGENVYAYSNSLWFGHAGFQVDWGPGGTGGMQDGRGHRVNIHNENFREVGLGLAYGTNGTVGPQLITQDFATQFSSPSFGTGVVYYDMNSNNFYDSGEGVSGLTVNVNGASYYCITADGGGWTVPIPSTATTRTVSFTGLGMNQNVNLVVPASKNAKADLKLTYSPPSISSPSTASTGSVHNMQFNAVGGASSYKWNRWTPIAAPAENCESTAGITSSTTGSYAVRSTSVKHEGTSSFHLALTNPPTSQSFQLNTLYYGNPSASISFRSSVRSALASEHFKVQVKEEGGTWIDAYDQAGAGSPGESTFNLRTAALTAVVGKAFRIRFLHQYSGGSYYAASDSVGWFVDAIGFSNVSALTNNTLTSLPTNSGLFTPATEGTYLMSVMPVISGRDFPGAYQTLTVTTGVPTPPSISSHPASTTIDSGSTVTLNVTASGTGPLTYQWYQGASGTTTTPVGTNSSSFTSPALTSSTSYWVKVTNSVNPSGVNSSTANITVNTPAVSVAVSPAGVPENGAANLVYTFTRTGPTTSALTVNFSVAGTATLTSDYAQSGAASFTASSGTVTIASGSSSKTVTLDPVADTTVEPDETAVLTVTSGSGYTVGSPDTATGTITNDDTSVSVAVSPSVVTEDGAGNLAYTFTRTGVTSGALTVNFSVAGTASRTSDYTQSGAATFGSTGTVVIAVGSTSATVTLNPSPDTTAETAETATLTVTSGTGYTVGSPSSASGTINNDDTRVTVTVAPSSVLENGGTNMVYTFTRTNTSAGAITVNFSVGGSAAFSTDYTQTGAASFTATSGSATFTSNGTTKTVTLLSTADTTLEPDETATLTVTGGTGYIPGDTPSATGTITNDDTGVSVTLSPSSVTEDSGSGLVYTFVRTGIHTSPLHRGRLGGTFHRLHAIGCRILLVHRRHGHLPREHGHQGSDHHPRRRHHSGNQRIRGPHRCQRFGLSDRLALHRIRHHHRR
jgi:Cysteine-rich secretory protein family